MDEDTLHAIGEADAKLQDALALNHAIYSELIDLGEKLKLVSDDCSLTAQAEALVGIERDYLNQIMVLLDDAIHGAPPKLEPEVIAAIIG